MSFFRKIKDKLIQRRVSHAAKVLRKHQKHHNHKLSE